MSLNLVTLLYLFASVCFIQALKGLSHPTTSIRGNVFGMVGMAVAVFTTGALIFKLAGQLGQDGMTGMAWVLGALLVSAAPSQAVPGSCSFNSTCSRPSARRPINTTAADF